MIANEENPAPIQEAAPEEGPLLDLEEEPLLGRSSAPTVRDLRDAAKDLFTNTEAEPASTPPDDRFPQKPA